MQTEPKKKETAEEKSARVKKFWDEKRKEKELQKQETPVQVIDQLDVLNLNNFPDIVQATVTPEGNIETFDVDKAVTNGAVFNVQSKQEPINQYMNTTSLPGFDEGVDDFVQEYKITVPTTSVKGRVSIKPYVSGEENMGLERYGEAIVPNCYQIDRMGCGIINGVKTYITGLNEQAPEIQLLDRAKKLAKIKEIRETVAYLENTINNNFEVSRENCMASYGSRDPKNPDDFWKKVTMFNSSGPDKYDPKGNRLETYWDKVELKLTNDGHALDLTKPQDLIIYHAIQARGLSMVAPSLQIAIDEPGYKFYMDTPFETAGIKTEFKKLRNKAGGLLDAMYETDPYGRLFYMSKLLAVKQSSLYKRGGANATPPDIMYEDICNYLDGKTADYDTKATVKRFLDFYELPIDEMIYRAVIKDATELHLIDVKGDGRMYLVKGNQPLGRTIEDIVEFLKNPLNEEVRNGLRHMVESEWASI